MAELAEKILLLLVSLPLGNKLVDLLLPVVALLQQLVVLLQQLGDLLLLLGGQQPQAAALPLVIARCCHNSVVDVVSSAAAPSAGAAGLLWVELGAGSSPSSSAMAPAPSAADSTGTMLPSAASTTDSTSTMLPSATSCTAAMLGAAGLAVSSSMVLSSGGLSCSDAVGAAVFDARGLCSRSMVNASDAGLRPARGCIALGKPSEVSPLALDEVRGPRTASLLGRAGFTAAPFSGALVVGAAAGSVAAAGLITRQIIDTFGQRPALQTPYSSLTGNACKITTRPSCSPNTVGKGKA